MKCIFCKADSSNSKSVEHIIPESFGSKTKVLPKGLVCDKCNNYFAVKIENPLLSHKAFRNLRAYYQVPSKKGNTPSLLGNIVESDVEINLKLVNGQIKIERETKGKVDSENPNIELSSFIFDLSIDPPKHLMSRFLAKMGVEALAYRFLGIDGLNEFPVENNHFDLIRQYARYGTGVKEWPFNKRRIHPAETKMFNETKNEWVQAGFGHDLLMTKRTETYLVFVLYGTEFVINLGGPSIKGYEEWLSDNNYISPLVERMDIQLEKKAVGSEMEYYLVGEYNTNAGLLFDKKQMGRQDNKYYA